MEKLYYISLLFLNFAILNILLSFIFFLLSLAGKFLIFSPHIKSRLFFFSLLAPPVMSGFMIMSSFAPPFFIKIPGKAMFCLNEPYCYIFSFIPTETPLFNGILLSAMLLVLFPLLYAVAGMRNYITAGKTINSQGNINENEFGQATCLIYKHLSEYAQHSHLTNNHFIGQASSLTNLKVLKEFVNTRKIKIRIIDSPHMISFLWGYIVNTLVISSGVIKTLTTDELKGLLSHELSHYKRRDNILKGLLLICRNSLYIFPQVHYIFNWWKEEIELISDEWAAQFTGRPLEIASALLKMKKHAPHDIGLNLISHTSGFSTSNSNYMFTRRIERLLTINDSMERSEIKKARSVLSETGLLAGIVLLFPTLFMAIYELDPLLVHCYIERILS